MSVISPQTHVEASPVTRGLLHSAAVFCFTHRKKKKKRRCDTSSRNPRTRWLIDSWPETGSFFPIIPEVGEGDVSFPLLIVRSAADWGSAGWRFFERLSESAQTVYRCVCRFLHSNFLHIMLAPVWCGVAVSEENPQKWTNQHGAVKETSVATINLAVSPQRRLVFFNLSNLVTKESCALMSSAEDAELKPARINSPRRVCFLITLGLF